MRLHRRIIAVAAMVTLLAGCEAGPNFVRSAPPKTERYTTHTPKLIPGHGEPAQQVLVNEAVSASWWKAFHSPVLDHIVRQAIAGSPNIAVARGRLAQAQQMIVVARGGLYPQVDAGVSAERQKGPPVALGIRPSHDLPTFNLYSVGAIVSFAPDVFGETRRRVERQQALANNQRYQLAAAQLVVTGNVVVQAFTIASLRSQVDAYNNTIADDRQNLSLIQQMYTAGKVARTTLLKAETRFERDRTLLPPLRQQLAAAQDALAILVGKSLGAWVPPVLSLDQFTLPADLPLSLPSTLVRQRPDILAAQARLHAASAAIGVAAGQLYPTVTLSAALDPASLTAGALFKRSNLAWNLLASLTAPLFHGGALRAQERASIAGYQAALASYQQTVLEGLRQVADTLRALNHDAQLVQAERLTLDSLDASLALERDRYAAGKDSLPQLLDADRRYQDARVGYARARAQRYLDSAQLYVALGGGGWRDDAPCSYCTARFGGPNHSITDQPLLDAHHEQ